MIANLIEPGRSLLGEAPAHDKLDLSRLIQARINRTIDLATQKGARTQSVESFLCALSVLPPPVPTGEMATAFGISSSEVDSLVADLFPLLDRTRHGIIFRDEPTETLVKQQYGSRLNLLNDVIERLFSAQSSSPYAARALPGLLLAMGRVGKLHQLAFDTRFPAALSSDVARRIIRLNRLRTALAAAAGAKDYDATVDLLVELSTMVAVDERGEDYLLTHPDLVVALGDPEALRRLFESRTGWPGTRHARLAVAYSTDGDTAEALAHATRADEWLRWFHRQDTAVRVEASPAVDEYAAAPLYLVARARITDAARYIDQWNDPYGYRVASKVFELCKVSAILGKLPGLPALLTNLPRCRKVSPPIITSALDAFATIPAAASKRMLRRLAKSFRAAKLKTDFPDRGNADSYRFGLLRAALRATHFGLPSEAQAILAFVSQPRFDFGALRDPFSGDYILPWLLAVVSCAAAEGRTPSLFDCVPEEFWHLVSDDATAKSDAEQQQFLEQRLREEPVKSEKGSDTPGRKQLSASDRSHAADRLRTRVLPLLGLARQLAALLHARSEEERRSAVTGLLESWRSALAAAQKDMYYPNEQRRYIDNLYSAAALQLFSALGLTDSAAAAGIADWMRSSPYVGASLCIEFVEHFAPSEKCQDAAGRMAVEAVRKIEREDNVPHRANLLARLARALLPANRAEAAALFARGLTELDAIGSGDHAFTSELLSFATSLKAGDPLRSDAALRLAKICELNIYDSGKFPWPLAGFAFARAWGLPYLAHIARWHDRDKADLELTLAPALSFLIRDNLIPADQALGLLRIVAPVEMWDWGWEHIIESLVEANPKNLPLLLNEAFDQIEHAFPERPRASTLQDIRKVLERTPRALAMVADRLARLEARACQPRKALSQSKPSEYRSVLHHRDRPGAASKRKRAIVHASRRTDPLSSESVEGLVDKLDQIDAALEVKSVAFKALRAKIKYADQTKHVEAVVAARNIELFAKVELLKDIGQQWLASSPTRLAALKGVGVRLIRQHAAELFEKDWGFRSDLNALEDISRDTRPELALERYYGANATRERRKLRLSSPGQVRTKRWVPAKREGAHDLCAQRKLSPLIVAFYLFRET